MSLVLGINASRARSGGAVAHLAGILEGVDPAAHGLRSVHLWSHRRLLAAIPDAPWLVKHAPSQLEGSIVQQLWWERSQLPVELKRHNCTILFNVDAGSICRFQPAVTMSQDLLSYEPGEAQRYGFGKARARLLALKYVQNAALRHADGAVFLTQYTARMIQASCGRLGNIAHIPHGVGPEFREVNSVRDWPQSDERPIRCLYISNAAPYKHQWHVVNAVGQLRQQGTRLELELVGGGEGKAQQRLDAAIAACDPTASFVVQRGFVPQHTLPAFFAEADLFVFASSCENMPVTLIEAMAAGLPIACSERGPMPEVLQDGGVYFNPEEPASIAAALDELIKNPGKRQQVARRAKELSQQYSWPRCAQQTFSFIAETAARATAASEA